MLFDEQIRNKNLAKKLKTLIVGIAIIGILFNIFGWLNGWSRNALFDNMIGLVIIIAILTVVLLFISFGSNQEE